MTQRVSSHMSDGCFRQRRAAARPRVVLHPLNRSHLMAKPISGCGVETTRNNMIYLDSTKTREAVLTLGARWIRVWWMIRPGFLSAAERGALIVVARDGLVEHRVARRANA